MSSYKIFPLARLIHILQPLLPVLGVIIHQQV